jgi:putative hydroxymethylpyrimidine transport system substrate-binding protein
MNMARQSKLAAAFAVVALTLALSACGEKSEPATSPSTSTSAASKPSTSDQSTPKTTEPLSLVLDFYPNPDHVGIYMAQKLGYFKEAGLDLSIHTPSDPAAPIKEVEAGHADVAISYEPEAMLALSHGLHTFSVAVLINRPLTSLIWLKSSGIRNIGDLRGKTIATAGIPYQDAFLKTILARAGLTPSDVKTVNVGYGLLPALVGGRADAMLGGFSNVEGVDLRLRGLKPVVTPVDKLGVPTYDELVLVGEHEWLEKHRLPVRLFLAALARGTAAAVENPGAATKALLEANPDLNPKLTKAEVEATLPSLGIPLEETPAGHPLPYGFIDQTEWAHFNHWMIDNNLVPGVLATSAMVSNFYLPSPASQ